MLGYCPQNVLLLNIVPIQVFRSLMKMRRGNGPKTEPCGIPVKISFVVEVSFSITANCFLPVTRSIRQRYS